MSDAHQLALQASQLDPKEYELFIDTLAENRRARLQSSLPEYPEDKSRDKVALWLAYQHLGTDPGITDVWYLPENASEKEIRLVEVNRLLREIDPDFLNPIDFGFDIEGLDFQLLVLDVTPQQLEELKNGMLNIGNWSFRNAQHFSL